MSLVLQICCSKASVSFIVPQVTSSCRSEKIRTYNFPQDRVTDHRINATSHNLAEFLKGQRPLDVLLDRLTQESRQERLQEFLDRLPTT